ncbi:MAG: hypothetical protein J5800_10265 [Spirochaetales bacterium]|nr:hypothetical protein [Spirochaetales bacterium]
MKKNRTRVFILLAMLATILILLPGCATKTQNAEWLTEKEIESLSILGQSLQKSTAELLATGGEIDNIYTDFTWNSIADTFPSKFDLRERGTVTPVKSQDPWGTCWSFATIAASETSILNSLGMTVDTYRETFGEEMDLSEKHLAWFTSTALPELDEYPQGEYPFDPSQAGEGLYFFDEETNPLDSGGNYFLSLASLASGIGILDEKYAPYMNSDGNISRDGDWSIPEDYRYAVSFELKHVNILPAPASEDEEGNYVYVPAATEAIKSELLAGRAVGISFVADQTMPEMEKEEMRERIYSHIKDDESTTQEEKSYYLDVRTGFIDTDELSSDELRDLILIRLRINDMPLDYYDLQSFDHDQLAMIFMSDYFGEDFETIYDEDTREPFMTFVGTDPVIYAQYTNEIQASNHSVTVVGWDDSFSAENWPEDRRPPADGVWIAKNSWGTDWGNDGYFLLSYYDMNLNGISSFDYVVDEDNLKMESLSILEYDNMPADIINSTLFDDPIYNANVFDIDEDCVLQYVSAMTGDLDTTVTASIYLLNENSSNPTDGILLVSDSETFRFAGYHRIKLGGNLLLPEGSRISIVVLESVPTENGIKYSLVNNNSLNKEGVAEFNRIFEPYDIYLDCYTKGVVNPGESFVSFEYGRWIDWTDVIEIVGKMETNEFAAFDNLPIKAYVYPWSQVQKVHDLSKTFPVAGGYASICPEDGFLLLDLAR